MYSDDRLVVSPSDLVGHLYCGHLTTLGLASARKELPVPDASDDELEVLFRRGLEHEAAHLAHLRGSGLAIVAIPDVPDEIEFAAAVAMTTEALRAGSAVVYQGAFYDDTDPRVGWRGHADFLTRVEEPGSTFGAFSYEPEDTKLARRVKPSAVLQLCAYAEMLARVQGVMPAQIHVVLGGQTRESLPLNDYDAYYRAAKHRYVEALLAADRNTYPEPVAHCAVCRWADHCDAQRLADDHLSLVANLSGDQTRKLRLHGVNTLTELADSPPELKVPRIGGATLDRLRQQARLQVKARVEPGSLPYELLESTDDRPGLAALPPPSPGDLFFDIEGDPFVDGGLEYLFGAGWLEDHEWKFQAYWAHDAAEERRMFQRFVDFVVERRAAYPDMHVYHYAAYEQTVLGRLMGRYATREQEVDTLFRGGVLVDLHRVVRQSLVIGTPSYSLKRLESLYMAPREGAIKDAGSSIVEYERWLQQGDDTILEAIREYNELDCQSTMLLREWLEARRDDAGRAAGVSLRRPDPPADSVSEQTAEDATATAALVSALTAGMDVLPDPATEPDAHATWLLAQLVDWHRREAKPEWWAYFRRRDDLSEDELYDDGEAIAGLTYVEPVEQVKKSTVHRYRFDPEQEHKLRVGSKVVDPFAERRKRLHGDEAATSPGKIHALDATTGTLDLIRGNKSNAAHPTCVIAEGPIDTTAQREALQRLAMWVIEHGIDAPGRYRAARDLLLRRPPRIPGSVDGEPLRATDESASDAAVRLALALDGGCLAIQGPPGAGKTHAGARMIVALVQAGHRVGITANSHSVIGTLLAKVMEEATSVGAGVRALQKADADDACPHPDVVITNDNAAVAQQLEAREVDVVAGTSWLLSRPEMDGHLDYLVVDEAGQLSLANVAALAGAATNLILIGDPQQLAQPSKGSHPPGAERSALEHLLGDHATFPEDRGLFLDRTWRLHPKICEFISKVVYEGRLEAHDECSNQTVADGPLLSGSGVRWLPVEHAGNRTSSDEEVDEVARYFRALLGREWTEADGLTAPLGLDNILVVAPYNAQVALLADKLPAGARIGTVDKFQGKEAAVVFVSLAASSAEDVPRGMEFLYNRNRLNVAVSRARALAVIVASPTLLSVRCHTVEQLRLANGLCRFVEFAHDDTQASVVPEVAGVP